MSHIRWGLVPLVVAVAVWTVPAAEPETLPGTKPLTTEGDLAAQMVAGIDKYLLRELASSVEKRKQYWKPDFSSPEAYTKSVQPNRARLKKMLGVVDKRVPVEMQYVATTETPALVAETERYKVYSVRWPVFEGVDAEGLLLQPNDKAEANVIAIPDADWTPEMIVGLSPGLPIRMHFARKLAEEGCRVLVPVLVDRKDTWSGNPRFRMTNQPHREYVYRMAFEMGRHPLGYEVQKVLAAVDWFAKSHGGLPIGAVGHGEGGLVALCSAAVDPRVQATVVRGCFGTRQDQWQEPIYRNCWGFLREFGDAELAALVGDRVLVLVHGKGPEVSGPPAAREGRSGAAPGQLVSPAEEAASREHIRFQKTYREKQVPDSYVMRSLADPPEQFDVYHFVLKLGQIKDRGEGKKVRTSRRVQSSLDSEPPKELRKDFDPAPRQKRQFDQLVAFTQKLLHDSEARRQEFFWSKLDTSSVEKYQKSTEPLRSYLWEEVIGKLPRPTEPMNPRTRLLHDTPKWKSYEVTLDLYPDVFAYGILCVPKDLKAGEKRPVVVCQHGLEGRPSDVVNPKEKTRYYNSFGSALADRGYIVYAPQNPYIGQDKFRVLQRKANPLKLSLFSFIVRQHERTLDWLAELPFVDPERMAFYGLSYGGKTAMRVPALLPRYCLSICSGDFNEWIAKNVSVDFRGSYMFTGEYEMFEFDLGNTFNYAEMAALIAPRPFMVERGHDDGVGIDEMVAYEYAKVRRLYSRLKLPERTAIEFFAGGHVINGKETFEFLDRHLRWGKK